MSVIVIREEVATLVVAAPGGSGGAVASVNGETGTVVLDAADVGAASTSHIHTLSQITDAGSAAAHDESDFELAGAVAGHVVAVDPHTQYQRESERNAANGYAGLDGSSKLNGSQQVYGTGPNTACMGDDSRLPAVGEKAALAGTSGTPGSGNKYVTQADASNTNARTPTDASVTLAKLTPFLSVFRDAPARRLYIAWAARGDTTRLINPSGAGTYSGSISTTEASASGLLQRVASAASINAVAGGLLWGTYGQVDRQMGPRFACRFRASSNTTDLRQFVGLSDTQLGSTDTPTCEGAYFRYSTSASDPGWVCVTNRGSSRTVSGSVRAFTASEVLFVAIDFDDTGTARFWMGTSESDMAIVHTSTSNLPFSSSAITACIGAGAVIAAARHIDFGHAMILTV